MVTSSGPAAGVDVISVDIGATVSGLPAPSHRVIPYRAELCIQVVEQDIGRRAPLADAASLREQTDPGPERIAEDGETGARGWDAGDTHVDGRVQALGTLEGRL